MRYIKLLVASVILVSMSACVADKTELEMQGYIKTINVVGPDKIAFEPISGAGQTKATSVDDGIALVFNWAVGDTLGIFPNEGNQVEFPIKTQSSSTNASFDGGGWALRNNASYAAYYPFNVWNYFQDNKTIIMDYSGQVQNGNGSFAHLSAYDYLASAKTTPENNMVTFQMDRQGAILYIDIVVPEPATITSLTISCDEAIFVEKAALDISGDTPVVTPIETKESLTLNFENTATMEQNETVRAYMAVQPVDFSAKTVTATLVTDASTYTAPVVSRVVNKGKAAFLRFSGSFTDNTFHGDPIDLSVNGTANCYVVPKAGEFSFDASVMGNGPEGYIWEQTQGTDMHLWPYHREEVYFSTNDVPPSQAFVIWDDNGVITDVVYNAETKRISFTATGNKGNALIGLFDKNATEAQAQKSRSLAYWSWHIWCTDSPKLFIQYDDKGDEYVILDRNLGATSADPADGEATYGYFYQFGRKDPIKGYDGIAGDQKKAQQELKYSVNHPTYLYKLNTKTKEWFNDGKSSLATVCADLWGNPAWQFCSTANIHPYQALRSELKKTIYDPCPPGYMVPPETAWTGIDAESIVILDNGVLIPTASGDSFYPFAGYISDLNSWENDSMGYYAYNGCTITRRERRVSRVYCSYTGLDSEFSTEFAPNHFGGCSLSLHIGDGDPIDYDHLVFEPMYQSNRQRGHNVRCVREFNK